MSRPTVLLFDVDGTLVLAGGAGKRAVTRAFAEVLGVRDALAATDFRGMTDLALFRAGLQEAGQQHDPALVATLLATYLAHLGPELQASAAFRVLPGVRELIAALSGRAHLAVGLGTGNVERGARMKLAHCGLDREFAFGGFGDDAEDRTELLRVGAARGADKLGAPLAACRVVVIGDSPRDVLAARGLGAECLAVATGGHPTTELTALGATHAVESLAADGVRELLLGSG